MELKHLSTSLKIFLMITMIKFILFFIFTFPFAVSSEEILYLSCKSPSGKSIYDLALPIADEESGEIRLRFEDQDILYTAKLKIVNKLQLIGVARFKASRSGHTEAKSWVFTYNISSNQLIDDGRLTASCE